MSTPPTNPTAPAAAATASVFAEPMGPRSIYVYVAGPGRPPLGVIHFDPAQRAKGDPAWHWAASGGVAGAWVPDRDTAIDKLVENAGHDPESVDRSRLLTYTFEVHGVRDDKRRVDLYIDPFTTAEEAADAARQRLDREDQSVVARVLLDIDGGRQPVETVWPTT